MEIICPICGAKYRDKRSFVFHFRRYHTEMYYRILKETKDWPLGVADSILEYFEKQKAKSN